MQVLKIFKYCDIEIVNNNITCNIYDNEENSTNIIQQLSNIDPRTLINKYLHYHYEDLNNMLNTNIKNA